MACEPNAPSKMVNSPTKPLRPGRPIEESETIREHEPDLTLIGLRLVYERNR